MTDSLTARTSTAQGLPINIFFKYKKMKLKNKRKMLR
uniref:Uncharacterized protein n=1 Tax=Anguilla anguilla TaxID=7936 RepID=A0A0E9SH70_ANGAN